MNNEEIKSQEDLEIEAMLKEETEAQALKDAEETEAQALKDLAKVAVKEDGKEETEHQERLRRVEETKINKTRYSVVSESFTTHGSKIIRLEKLVNGNVKKTFAGTKKSNPVLWKKAKKG